jgi:hypothetical protein
MHRLADLLVEPVDAIAKLVDVVILLAKFCE